MGFYFCEKCGKRVTDADLEAGRARDKQLRGIYCEVCAEGARTLAFDAISREELRRDEQNRYLSGARSTSVRLPASKASHGVSHRRLRLGGVSQLPMFAVVAGCAAIALVAIAAFSLTRADTTGTAKPKYGATFDQPVAPTPAAHAVAVAPTPRAEQVPPVRPLPPYKAPGAVVLDDPVAAGNPAPERTAAGDSPSNQTGGPTPPSAMDAEGRARVAFDELDLKLKQLAEDDKDGRMALYEGFLREHGTSIVASRVRTKISEAQERPSADAGTASSPEHVGATKPPSRPRSSRPPRLSRLLPSDRPPSRPPRGPSKCVWSVLP